MPKHHFNLTAEWPGGRNSVGQIETDRLKTEISIPPEMDGPGIGTNPDEMLLGAAATCYIITLGAMIERAELPLHEMSMTSEGIVDVTKGVISYDEIIHHPVVSLKNEATEAQFEKLKKLVEKAESSCMISRAVQGNVKISLDPSLSIQ
ncbi:OsmC family protein [Pontibacillus salipaludis]|uniref:OsmC family protein n=1 Tax=Pontibacillus salipaludis TaxID=1697394 RepID=UPI0031E74747